jgi:hypothetical protein
VDNVPRCLGLRGLNPVTPYALPVIAKVLSLRLRTGLLLIVVAHMAFFARFAVIRNSSSIDHSFYNLLICCMAIPLRSLWFMFGT